MNMLTFHFFILENNKAIDHSFEASEYIQRFTRMFINLYNTGQVCINEKVMMPDDYVLITLIFVMIAIHIASWFM